MNDPNDPNRDLTWTRLCGSSACLEVARDDDGTVYLRNSTVPGAVIEATPIEWESFVDAIRGGDRDAILRGELA